MQKRTDWGNVKNILCIRPDNLGDVLMTAPAIRALKECVQDRKITLLTSSAGSSIVKHISEIDDMILFDTPWEKNQSVSSVDSINLVVQKIKQLNFDGAVIFNVYSQNPLPAAMLCFMAGIPKVAGYCRENPYKLLTDWFPDPEPLYDIRHEVTRQLDLVKMLGATCDSENIELSISDTSLKNCKIKMENMGIDLLKKSIIIHPGVSEPKRQYPIGFFAEAAKKIVEELDYQVILTGVESEKILAEQIISEAGENVFSLAGLLNIEELIGLIRSVSLLISNNTGPVHIASALVTPVVVLYALTNPQHAPWNVNHRVLPFDIPDKMKSNNTIISFANQKTFTSSPDMVSPCQIVQAVKELISDVEKNDKTQVLYT
jgi:lipopolysaccharide heptosyltransferase II